MCRYELPDSSVIKARVILTDLKRVGMREPKYLTQFKLEIRRNTRKNHLAESTDSDDYSDAELLEAVIESDVKFSATSVKPSEYLLDDGSRIVLNLDVSRISKTSKIGKDSKPIYLFGSARVGTTVKGPG